MQTTPTKLIIDKFGGMSALSRALGHLNPTTVQGWSERDRIPAAQIPNVMKAAADLNISLTYEEFFEGAQSAA